jgi:zinc resistance-associated protein
MAQSVDAGLNRAALSFALILALAPWTDASAQTSPSTSPPQASAAASAQAPTSAPDPQVRAARDAFRDARRAMAAQGPIVALRGGLALTPEQDPLWRPVEDALLALASPRRPGTPASDDPTSRLRAEADAAAARAQGLTRLADALAPLQASFSDEQKWRFQALSRRYLDDRRPLGRVRSDELAGVSFRARKTLRGVHGSGDRGEEPRVVELSAGPPPADGERRGFAAPAPNASGPNASTPSAIQSAPIGSASAPSLRAVCPPAQTGGPSGAPPVDDDMPDVADLFDWNEGD